MSKLLLIDPNKTDFNDMGNNTFSVITPEMLSISVELNAIKKDRSAILVSNNSVTVKSGSDAHKINFLGGFDTNNKDGSNSLTTHYTELSSAFNEKNKDLETLGIDSIDIEFASNYAPMVTINFTDTRGKLFELGKESPYSVFFEFPYPIFELTIKGYYGKAVKYKLHLLKFNGSFDYSTGSFKIKCNFIGYTFAFLSDILMGHLKGVIYTKKGAAKVIEKQNNQRTNHQFISFKELNDIIENISVSVAEIQQSDEQLKGLAKSSEAIEKLTGDNQFKQSFVDLLNNFNSDNRLFNKDFLYGYSYVSPSVFETFNVKVNEFNSNVTDLLKTLNDFLDVNFKLNVSNYLIKDGSTYFLLNLGDFVNDYDTYIKEFEDTSSFYKIFKDKEVYDYFKINLNDYIVNSAIGAKVIVLNFDKYENEIKILVDKLNSLTKSTIPKLANKILKESNIFKLGDKTFDPSIGNLVNLVCDHVDIFLECIKDVAVEAESDEDSRREQLKNFVDGLDKIDGSFENLKAFPNYFESDIENNNAPVEKWIGTVAPNLPEVIFINELLDGIILSHEDDEKTNEEVLNNKNLVAWYPVNVFDSPLFNFSNPYNALSEEGVINDYIRLMLTRLSIFAGYSNLYPTNENIKLMALNEANNLFKSISSNADVNNGFKTKYADIDIDTFLNIFLPDRDGVTIFFGLYDGPINQNNSSNNGRETNLLCVTYKTTARNLETNNLEEYFLPLNSLNGYKDFSDTYYGEFLIGSIPYGHKNVTDEERIEFRNNGTIFFSDRNLNTYGNHTYIDTGATSIKILDLKDLNFEQLEYPVYEGVTVDMKNDVVNMEENFISSGFNSLFFKANTSNYTNLPMSLLFYSNSDKLNYVSNNRETESPFSLTNITKINNGVGTINNKSIANTSEVIDRDKLGFVDILSKGVDTTKNSIPYFNFSNSSTFYSLFGSDLYYQQTDIKAKAYLFLHSIPFDGLTDSSFFGNKCGLFTDNNYIGKLFKQKNGFIETSYSWCLFIGAILSRRRENFNLIFGNKKYSFLPNSNISNYPRKNEFCINKGGDFFSLGGSDGYIKIDDCIVFLPLNAKKQFISIFDEWVNNGFTKIKNNLEVFKEGVSQNERYDFWVNFDTKIASISNNTIINENFVDNYHIIVKTNENSLNGSLNSIINDSNNNTNGSPFNFFCELNDNTKIQKILFDFLLETKIIVNSSWRTWSPDDNILVGDSKPVFFKKEDLKTYLSVFFTEYTRLYGNDLKINEIEKNETKNKIFDTIDNNDIKLNLYIKVKSIYDKWICGEDSKYIGITKKVDNKEIISNELYDSFRFIDRSFNNIEDKFKINLIPLVEELNGNYNQSFYNFIAKVLSDNNFDFFPLPSYINYNSIEELNNVFKPYSFNKVETTVNPSFVCMYSGQKSNSSNDVRNFTSDSFNFNIDPPPDFTTESNNSDSVPVFLLQYGVDNQSIFKNIELDQSEFTATDESLKITENLSKSNMSGIGQNLFDVYINRSYTANVEMLGNVMIQPLMCFQLDNVPMFRGAYSIIKVSHSIKPNSMVTNFKGVKIRKTQTKMVDETTIFRNLFDNFKEVNSNNANLNNLVSGDYSSFVTYTITEKPGVKMQVDNKHNYAIKEVVLFFEYVANLWYNKKVGVDDSEDVLYVGSASKINGGSYGGNASTHSENSDHNYGLAIDFRPMSSEKTKNKNRVVVGNGKYSSKLNQELIQLFIDSQKDYDGWDNNKIIKEIFTTDQAIIDKFPDIVKFDKDHADHIHISFYPPTEVLKKIAENDQSTFNPTTNGLITKIDDNESFKKLSIKEKYLGQII